MCILTDRWKAKGPHIRYVKLLPAAQDLPVEQLCRYCFYSRADFWVFALQGRHIALIKVKFQIWQGGRHSPCQISPWSVQGCGFFTAIMGGSPARFLQNLQSLCAIYIPRWWRFHPNFRWTLAGKLLMGPKKVWGEKLHGTDHLYHHVKFGGNRTTHGGVRVQSVMFFTFSRASAHWCT